MRNRVELILDTGATAIIISESAVEKFNLPVSPASKRAWQADGVTPLVVVGEVPCVNRGTSEFVLDALVVKRLYVDVLAGNPFLKTNAIGIRPAKDQIIIGGMEVVCYSKSPRLDGAPLAEGHKHT